MFANKPVTCDILCVAGGGGGGADIGGGGGGGGFRTLTSQVLLSAGTYAVVIGAGGNGAGPGPGTMAQEVETVVLVEHHY